jgi:filamentous hemagglutinin family protein
MKRISWLLTALNAHPTALTFLLLPIATAAIGTLSAPANAQSIIPAPDGTGTIVTPEGNRIDITGGQRSRDGVNLFHSLTRFGLSAEQIANFLSQPHIQNILARINGGEASFINGLIQVTGGNSNLFLLNPAGIIFGSNASLNVPAAFIATTANGIGFNNNWFNAIGNNNYADLVGTPNAFAFTMNQPGGILNGGKLAVGMGQDLTLLAGTVVNTGTLSAPSGNITLAAVPGESIVRLSQPGFVLNLEIQPLTTAANQPQNWTLPILSLPQLLTGGNGGHATGVRVNPDGGVQLTGSGIRIPTEGKTTIASGSINVSGQIGGTVNVLGDKVGIIDANINASGTNGGGRVLIGGDDQGKGTIPNAARTYVSSNSAISVDSFVAGNGGAAIVWADKITEFYGSISAKGGSNSGDGGFVEVSGKDSLIFAGKVDTRAAKGNLGTLLLDPINITIVEATAAPDDAQLGDREILQGDSPSASFTISAIALENLPANANIILEATNNITINNLADDALNFKATTGSITFKSDADRDGVGSFSMDATDSIQTQGGSVAISGKNLTVGSLNTNGGNITLDASGNIDTSAGTTNASNTGGDGGDITFIAGGDITTGNLFSNTFNSGSTSGSVTLTSNAGTIDTTAGSINTSTPIAIVADGGAVTLNAKSDIRTASIITFVAATSIGKAGNISLTSTAGAIDTSKGVLDAGATDGSGGSIALTAVGNITTGRILSYIRNEGSGNAGDISLISIGGAIDTTKDTTKDETKANLDSRSEEGNGGNITLKAAGDITTFNINSLSVTNGAAGNVIFTTSGGNITITGGIDAQSKDSQGIGSGGNIDLSAAGNITTDTIDTTTPLGGTSGNIIITSNDGFIDTSAGILDTRTAIQIQATGKGGAVTLNAKGDITTGSIFSLVGLKSTGNAGNISLTSKAGAVDTSKGVLDAGTTFGNGGAIEIKAAGDINTGTIASYVVNQGSGNGGNISLISTGGGIDTTKGTTPSEGKANLDSRSEDGNGGAIALEANGNITTGFLGSFSSGAGNAGNINITSKNGAIDTSTIEAKAFGTSGNGGAIALTAAGDITPGGLDTRSTQNGDGGNITAIAGGNIIGAVDTNSGATNGKGGNITFQAGGDIIADDIFSFGSQGGGNIQLTSGGNIDITDSAKSQDPELTPGTILSCSGSDSNCNGSGAGGNITLEATKDIVFGGISASGLLGGGKISLTSGDRIEAKVGVNQEGELFGGFLDTSSKNGAGGAIALKAPNNITTGDINAVGLPNTGNISLTSNKIEFTGGNDAIPSVASKGSILLQPATPSQNIVLAESGTTDINISALKDGFSSITIGRTDGTGTIAVNPVTFTDPVTIQSGNGAIAVNSPIIGKDNASIALKATTTTLNANITTADQNILIEGGTLLANDVILSTGSGAGDIIFSGAVDGANLLSVDAGTGNIAFNGAIGNNNPLSGLIIDGQNVEIKSTAAVAGNIDIDAGGTIDLNNTITTTKGGSVTITNTGNLTLAADNFNLDGAFIQDGQGAVLIAGNLNTTDDDIRFSSPVTLAGNTTFNPGVGAIAFKSSLSAGNNPLILKAREIDFGGAVSGTNTLALQPATKEQNIAIADSIPGALNLTAAEIANLQNGFSSITIGRSDGTGNVTVNNVTFNDPVTIQSGLGAIAINAPITGKDNASIALNAATITLNANITTADQNITIGRSVLLGSDVTLTTGAGAGDITFNGTVDGTKQLKLDAGKGNVQFNAAAGFLTPLASLEIINAQNVLIAGGIATANRDMTFNSPTILTDDVTFKVGAANITFNSSISTESSEANDLSVTAEGSVLTGDITTGGGNISLSSNKGTVTTGTLDAASAAGQGGAIALTAPAGAVTAGNLNARGATGGGSVTVISGDRINTGNIDVSTSNGDGGSVSIDPPGDVEVGFINAQGGTGGKGGNVDITTEGFFRATSAFTDRNGINSSISTAGETDTGSIIIRHGGGDLETFFIVDDPTTNGTLAALTTGADTISPTRFFPGSFRLGNIQIITSDRFAATLTQSDILRENPPPQEIIGDIPRAPIDSIVAALEEIFTRQYETYFGQLNLTPIKSLEQIRATLLAAEQATGVKSAGLYIAFGRGKVGLEALLASPQNPLQTSPRPGDEDKIMIDREAVRDRTDNDVLELVLVTAEGEVIRHRVEGVTRSQILAVARELLIEVTDRANINTTSYLPAAQQLYQWLIAPLETQLQARGIENLVLIPDIGLRSLPFATLHNGEQFIVEKYSVSLMPSFSLTNPRYVNLKNAFVLAMGASQFTNLSPLPAVPVELNTITPQLWPGNSFLNQDFTLDNLKLQRDRRSFSILHLATHAEFRPGNPSYSYIQFWDTQLGLDQVKSMKWNDPPLDLLVLSACRTALGSEEVELGFAGLAVQTGVKSAIASLWYVSDEGTLGLMTEFYEQLKTAPIRAEALRQAQLSMIRKQVYLETGNLYGPVTWGIPLPLQLRQLGDKDLSHPYYWAAFTTIGNPW